jgi:hypothetical protein
MAIRSLIEQGKVSVACMLLHTLATFLYSFLSVWAPKGDVQRAGCLTFTVWLSLYYDVYTLPFPWVWLNIFLAARLFNQQISCP